jgi:cysteinyl-tRNA synthetase
MDDGYRGLRLTNTMTRAKQEFRPLDWADAGIPEAAKEVRMYVCGPTVYDFAHIGNARPVIVFDVLFRLLRHLYGAEHVTYVRNITDVDDKINARAARDFPGLPLNEAIRRVTETTAAQFQKDATALGSLPPTHQPRATDFVTGRSDGPDMVSMISTLIERGHAYEAADEVLFDVTSMPDYGKLSNRKLEDQQAGARVAVDGHKKNPGDFVLWKLSDANEPGWESPWGRGRPGWHIECSVMSEAFLGATFDIHGGGLDLIFPHHENELAQSMSKSDGNFITIAELLETETFGGRKWDGAVLRLAMLMTHYREPIDFSVKRLEEAEDALAAWSRAADGVAASQPSQRFLDAWSDDLGGSAAIAELHALRKSDPAALRASAELIGLTLAVAPAETAAEDPAIAARVAERLALLKAKDFAGADAIRAELLAEGIQLKDGKDTAGERVTTWELKR